MNVDRRGSARVVELNPHQSVEPRSMFLRERLFLWLVVVAGVVLRLDFMRASGFVIDSDEAIVGLMAKHILEGTSLPVFYYGQHYMGSLEPLCVAVAFAIFGVSSFVLQLVPLLFSALLIVIMYRLGKEVAGPVVGRVAALLCAFPPASLVVWSFKARGGFIELLVIGALAFWLAVRWFRKTPTDRTYPALIWFLLGIGWWVNNQIIFFMGSIGLFGALRVLLAWRKDQLSVRQILAISGVCASAFFVGSSPYWVYNLSRGFPSLGMFGFAPFNELSGYVEGLFTTALPIILGAKKFWEKDASFAGATLAVYAVYATLGGALVYARRRKIVDLLHGTIDRVEPIELFGFFVVFTCAVFAVSSFGWLSQAPRYLLPLYVGIFVLVGYCVKLAHARSRALAALIVVVLVGIDLASCYAGGRALPGEPVVFKGERVSRDHSELLRVLDELKISKVRTNYWIGYRLAFESKERVTFRVLHEPRQIRIPEYQLLPSGTHAYALPLVVVPAERELVALGLSALGYSFKERLASGYSVIYDLKRTEPSRRKVSRDEIERIDGSGSRSADEAIDERFDTRWGTGEPQRPGQFLSVTFMDPVPLVGITYNFGLWGQDYPRGLEVYGEDATGRRFLILSGSQYPGALSIGIDGELALVFPRVEVKRILLAQTGAHPIFDWSVGELEFYVADSTRSALSETSVR